MLRSRLKNGKMVRIDFLGDHADAIRVVASWIYREWSFLYEGKTKRTVEDLFRQRLHKKVLPLTLVAFIEGTPVGTVSLKTFDIENRTDLTPWVASLYVVSRFREQGIGSALMHAVEQKAARMGIPALYLFTADPALASRFYQRLGWKVRERSSYRSHPTIIMEKQLTSTRTVPARSDAA